MIEEDYILPPSTVDTRPWHRPLADLGAAVELLSVFDWLHDVRAMTVDAFVDRRDNNDLVWRRLLTAAPSARP